MVTLLDKIEDENDPVMADRVQGHAIAGVEGVYDRHDYLAEKHAALCRLADLIDLILNPKPNVVQLGVGRP